MMFLVFASLLILTSQPNKEFLRLTADLDGDGHDEVASLSSSGKGDFADFTVSIGKAKYSDKYFTVEGDKPSANFIRLDYSRASHQILIEVSQAASCDYHILGYSNGRILPLLVERSPVCYEPKIFRNGKVATQTWEGFWRRTETYALDKNGTTLMLQPALQYDVGVTGTTGTPIELEREVGCKFNKVSKGDIVKIESYKPSTNRFLIRESGNICGWLENRDVEKKFTYLPWAN